MPVWNGGPARQLGRVRLSNRDSREAENGEGESWLEREKTDDVKSFLR